MFRFKSLLEKELHDIEYALSSIGEMTARTRRIAKKKRGKNYYYYIRDQKCGRQKYIYLGARTSKRVQQEKKNAYMAELFNTLKNDIRVIRTALAGYTNYDHLTLTDNLPVTLKDVPLETSFDVKLGSLYEWARGGVSNPASFGESVNYACDGTRVRSKGECIWFDLLIALGIPFRYDKAMEIITELGPETVYPDFQIKCMDGTLILVEHLGMLDDPDYARRFVKKCQDYIRNGFVIGDNLLLTSDNASHGTNAEVIAKYVREIEQRFHRAE